jgi:DNA polymerase gamma 1
MRYLIDTYKIQARLLITIHDEIRFLVKKEDALRATMALQISNIWTRAYFAHRCGMDDLPWSVAFFSAVDVDHVLRKEVSDPCKTPSQPEGLPTDGQSLSIYDTIKAIGLELKDDRGRNPTAPMDTVEEEPVAESNKQSSEPANAAWLKAQMMERKSDIINLLNQS